MLIIQTLNTYYSKQERSSEFARLRTDDLFRKLDCGKVEDCEVFEQRLNLYYRQGVSPAEPGYEKYKKYGQEIFTEDTGDRYDNTAKLVSFIRIFKEEEGYRIRFCNENVAWCPTYRRGHNEAFNDEKSVFYHKDGLYETAFVLGKNQYGRIIFNNRYVEPDTQHWRYGWHVYNIINCDFSDRQEKMFFEKNPDYVYKQLLDLK